MNIKSISGKKNTTTVKLYSQYNKEGVREQTPTGKSVTGSTTEAISGLDDVILCW